MLSLPIDLTLVGGPTVLIEIGNARLLTDPTFDPPGEYQGTVLLAKTESPAMRADELGPVDAVLLSHDQHFDNLDASGRAYVMASDVVVTTPIAAKRLGGNTVGLRTWERTRVLTESGLELAITSTPARHGPPGAEATLGDVSGFLVQGPSDADLVYVTGDTVFYEGVAETARRYDPALVLVFAGAAQTRGRFNLTMGNNDLLELASIFPDAQIVAVHNSGWSHFTETAADVRAAAEAFGLGARISTLEPGVRTRICETHSSSAAA